MQRKRYRRDIKGRAFPPRILVYHNVTKKWKKNKNKFTIGNILCCSVIAKGRVCRFMAQTGN